MAKNKIDTIYAMVATTKNNTQYMVSVANDSGKEVTVIGDKLNHIKLMCEEIAEKSTQNLDYEVVEFKKTKTIKEYKRR